MVKAKRGRPKIDRPAIDTGTPEMQARRIALVGSHGDLALAEYPLGVLLARKLITQQEHDAGRYFAYLYGRVVGRTSAKVPGGQTGWGDEGATAAQERLLKEAQIILGRCGLMARYEVTRICIDEQLPAWFQNADRLPSMSDPGLLRRHRIKQWHVGGRGYRKCCEGLEALALWREYGLRVAGKSDTVRKVMVA